MAADPKHPPGPPMDLANMREQSVNHLVVFCHNDACRHQALIDVSSYSGDVWFKTRVKCGKCGRSGSVSPILTDPISNGFITSYSHPGGNVTGVLLTLEGLAGKLVELAVEMMPRASSLGVLVNASNPATNALQLRDASAAAAAIPIKLIPVEVRASEWLPNW
jgi:hypothetical protein